MSFNVLPLELRLKIWACFLPEPQIIDVVAVTIHEEQRTESLSSSDFADPTRWLADHPANVHSYLTPNKILRSYFQCMYAVPQQSSVPVLLHINSETRVFARKACQTIPSARVFRKRDEEVTSGLRELVRSVVGHETYFLNCGMKDGPPTLFNPRRDILFLTDPARADSSRGNEDLISSLAVLLRWLDPAIVKEVRYLAIPYPTWRRDLMYGYLKRLKEFARLERIWVYFMVETTPKNHIQPMAWASLVRTGERSTYFNRAKEQVLGDWRGLEREWKESNLESPQLDMINDRTVLIELFGGDEA